MLGSTYIIFVKLRSGALSRQMYTFVLYHSQRTFLFIDLIIVTVLLCSVGDDVSLLVLQSTIKNSHSHDLHSHDSHSHDSHSHDSYSHDSRLPRSMVPLYIGFELHKSS